MRYVIAYLLFGIGGGIIGWIIPSAFGREWWRFWLGQVALWSVMAGVLLLSGCDDYEMALAQAEYRERFMEACMPRKGDLVTAEWVKGKLVCQRTTPTGRYGQTFPHTENRIAIVEPL